MHDGRSKRTRRARRGVVLFEVLVSLAIFAGAAMYVLTTIQGSLQSLDRDRQMLRAMDAARSRMSTLESGAVTLSDLREGSTETADGWTIDVRTNRTEYSGLLLVEVHVSETGAKEDADHPAVKATLRQIVRMDDEEAGSTTQSEAGP
ncbi:MAG TPA: hypothetical protein VG711_03440 [Phycisphaerales bacterium]|nr:hypothetical protein [Phycisphaerales bacterium]